MDRALTISPHNLSESRPDSLMASTEFSSPPVVAQGYLLVADPEATFKQGTPAGIVSAQLGVDLVSGIIHQVPTSDASHSENEVVRYPSLASSLSSSAGEYAPNSIPPKSFAGLITRILGESCVDPDFEIEDSAIAELQSCAEMYMVRMFEDAKDCAAHAKRVTIRERDLNMACIFLRLKRLPKFGATVGKTKSKKKGRQGGRG